MKAILPNKLILLLVVLITAATLKSQTVVSYHYDNSGRRTERVIMLKSARPEQLLNDTASKEKQKEIFEEKIGEQTVIIYPNPTRGELKVEILNYKPETRTTIRLYTLSGKLLLTQTPAINISSLDLSAYPVGTYILKIILDDKASEWKIIKE